MVNQAGQSPLSLALKGSNPPPLKIDMTKQPIWLLLLLHSADTNIVYPEDSHEGTVNGLKIPDLPERNSSSKSSKKRELTVKKAQDQA